MKEQKPILSLPVLTVGDMLLIEALEPDVRAAVERYAGGGPTLDSGLDALKIYQRGYEDGYEQAESDATVEFYGCHTPDALPKDLRPPVAKEAAA